MYNATIIIDILKIPIIFLFKLELIWYLEV